MSRLNIAFWNLQNLFDTTASDIATDFEFTPANGWTEEVFNRKLTNLASVIKLMHGGQRPDLLGVCEIENKLLADKLTGLLGRGDYDIAHDPSPDIRGIDTSLIYSRELFELAGEPVGHNVHLRYSTRDIFQVPLRIKDGGAAITVFVNHWPSRSKGIYESEPFRLTVASHCGQLVDQVLKFPRDKFLALPDAESSLAALNDCWNGNVLLMGDFNDEPFNRSILEFLQASSAMDHLEEEIRKPRDSYIPPPPSYLGKQAYLFNCMWRFLGVPDEGTHYFSESINTMNMLDQFIVSRGLLNGLKGLKIDLGSVEIFKPGIMTTKGKKRPKRFEFDKKGITSNGYSDHFPIQASIEVLP